MLRHPTPPKLADNLLGITFTPHIVGTPLMFGYFTQYQCLFCRCIVVSLRGSQRQLDFDPRLEDYDRNGCNI